MEQALPTGAGFADECSQRVTALTTRAFTVLRSILAAWWSVWAAMDGWMVCRRRLLVLTAHSSMQLGAQMAKAI